MVGNLNRSYWDEYSSEYLSNFPPGYLIFISVFPDLARGGRAALVFKSDKKGVALAQPRKQWSFKVNR